MGLAQGLGLEGGLPRTTAAPWSIPMARFSRPPASAGGSNGRLSLGVDVHQLHRGDGRELRPGGRPGHRRRRQGDDGSGAGVLTSSRSPADRCRQGQLRPPQPAVGQPPPGRMLRRRRDGVGGLPPGARPIDAPKQVRVRPGCPLLRRWGAISGVLGPWLVSMAGNHRRAALRAAFRAGIRQ